MGQRANTELVKGRGAPQANVPDPAPHSPAAQIIFNRSTSIQRRLSPCNAFSEPRASNGAAEHAGTSAYKQPSGKAWPPPWAMKGHTIQPEGYAFFFLVDRLVVGFEGAGFFLVVLAAGLAVLFFAVGFLEDDEAALVVRFVFFPAFAVTLGVVLGVRLARRLAGLGGAGGLGWVIFASMSNTRRPV